MINDIDEKIYQFTHAEIVKEFLLLVLDLINKFESQGKDKELKAEIVMKWVLEITLRETEIAIKVGKHKYFNEIRQKLIESINIFDKANLDHVSNMVRDALTKSTSIGAISHQELLKK
ncbi:MAG: hypothetical protein EAX96_03055 [Candidatus Lokiarchaeota archaeon]|nr:hypothetical protein [Candidatus Lokiarchaeota archaeon]